MAIKKGYVVINAHLRSGSVRKRLLDVMSNKETMREVHQKLKEFVEPYVPMSVGRARGDGNLSLRESAEAKPSGVIYKTPYAHYQYEGKVYGQNLPKWYYSKADKTSYITGWYSIPGVKKTPTGRTLGQYGNWKGWDFGYSTPDTTHHWMEEAFKNGGKARFSKQATRVMKARARRLNKKW